MNRINVKVWPTDPDLELEDDGALTFNDVNYISLVNHQTYGIPALISEEKVKNEGLPATILYVSTQNIVAMEAERVE